MAAIQPALDGTEPVQADDYETWYENHFRPAFVEVAATGQRFVVWEVKRAYKIAEPPDPSHDWGRAIARLHSEKIVKHDGFGRTPDKSCVNAWRGTRAARAGRAA